MTPKTNESNLERMEEKVTSRMKGKKQLFPVLQFPDERVVDWEGDDIDGFLTLCEESHGSLIYVNRKTAEPADADNYEVASDHIGELLYIEVAFLQDGYFHRFREAAPWWSSYCQHEDEESLFSNREGESAVTKKQAREIKAGILKLKEGEITDEFLGGFMKSGYSDIPFEHRLYEYIRKKCGLPASNVFGLRAASEDAYEAFNTLRDAVEEKLVDYLVPSLIEWAKSKGLDKIQKADVAFFLSKNHLKLSKEAVNALWRNGLYEQKEAEFSL